MPYWPSLGSYAKTIDAAIYAPNDSILCSAMHPTTAPAMDREIEAIHEFWFGPLDAVGLCTAEQHQLWFAVNTQSDAWIRNRFGSLVEDALAGDLDDWCDDDLGIVALVLLLDQFTRNIYRHTAQAFAGDEAALAVANLALETGRCLALPAIHRVFLLLPLEHSEDVLAQDECVNQFLELERQYPDERVTRFTQYAQAHRDVIAQFGRFPHRNAVLGRASTPAEKAFLQHHKGF
ncbi:MAG: DUF924 family protein [Pseudomonadota bacterium]